MRNNLRTLMISVLVTVLLVSIVSMSTTAQSQPATSAREYVEQAIAQYNRGNYTLAVELLRKATALNGRYARAYAWLGLCYVRLGREQDAIAAFRTVIRLAPASEDARIARQWLSRLEAIATPSVPSGPVVLLWKGSPVPAALDCSGPSDSNGRQWNEPPFDDSGWLTTLLPDENTWACDMCDRFYRSKFTLTSFRRVTIRFASDDSIEIWINGSLVGRWGPGCQQGGCVNNPRGICAINTDVAPVDITRFLIRGSNALAVHVSTAGGGHFFDLKMTVE